MAPPSIGDLLRGWPQRRRLTQLDLALAAGVSTRHLSFVETGRSRPSADMVMRLRLHPDGMAPLIANLGEWRAHLLERLGRELVASGDPALYEELAAYPGPSAPAAAAVDIAVPLRLRAGGGELAFISTVTTFGTATDVTVSELSIESFFPADVETAERVRALLDARR